MTDDRKIGVDPRDERFGVSFFEAETGQRIDPQEMGCGPKITVDDLLNAGPMRYRETRFNIYGTVWPERPARKRFDPRRLADRFRKTPTTPIVISAGSRIVYSVTGQDDLYPREEAR